MGGEEWEGGGVEGGERDFNKHDWCSLLWVSCLASLYAAAGPPLFPRRGPWPLSVQLEYKSYPIRIKSSLVIVYHIALMPKASVFMSLCIQHTYAHIW